MKTFRLLCISTILFLLVSGCARTISCACSKRSFPEEYSFHVVLVRPSGQGLVRLPVIIDDKKIKLKSGAFIDVDLAPGTYVLSSGHGIIVGHFPRASLTISGNVGETRYFSYVMKYRQQGNYYPFGLGVNGNIPSRVAYQADWKEISENDFKSKFPDAKFNN